MAKTFISYRRDDAKADARHLHDRLARTFGSKQLFMDVDNLLAGQRFDQELDSALNQCDVLLAVIGRRWLDILQERTAADERDYVHDEIAAALKRKVIVIPVLVDGATLPSAASLPEDIRDLALYQKQDVTHENFGRDVASLVSAIKTARKVQANKRGRSPAIAITASATIFLILCSSGYFLWPHLSAFPSLFRYMAIIQKEIAGKATTGKLEEQQKAIDTTIGKVDENAKIMTNTRTKVVKDSERSKPVDNMAWAASLAIAEGNAAPQRLHSIFTDLQKRYPRYFAEVSPDIRRSHANKSLYSLNIGPFSGKDIANHFCDNLKKEGHSTCQIAQLRYE